MTTHLDDIYKYLLQRNIKITLNRTKLLRRGRLILYTIKDHVISFTLHTNKGTRRVYEMHYPFHVELDKRNSTCTMSYNMSDVTKCEDMIKRIKKRYRDPSQFFDNQIVIEFE